MESIKLHIPYFVLIAFGIGLLFLVAWMIQRDYQTRMQNRILRLQLQEEQNMYEKVNSIYEQTRILNHDLKHYLTVVLGLLVNENYEEAKQKVIELIGNRMEIAMVLYTASDCINAVLNDKLLACRKKDIDLRIQVSGTVGENQDLHVAIILANLLDNAIEAAEKNGSRTVILDMYEIKGMYTIVVKNQIRSSVLKANPKLSTTKRNKVMHGYGLKSVKFLLHELEGKLVLDEEDGWFISQASFVRKDIR